MTDLTPENQKRKVLSLKLEPQEIPPGDKRMSRPQFLRNKDSVFMVWSPGSEMPKRVYQSNEHTLAISHAKALASLTGQRFYVMRSWRGYEPGDD